MHTPDTPTQPTQRAARDCANWLRACLQLGWRRESLADLEEIWWTHHDYLGRLCRAERSGRDDPPESR